MCTLGRLMIVAVRRLMVFGNLDHQALFGLDQLANVFVVGCVRERSVCFEAIGTEIRSLFQ